MTYSDHTAVPNAFVVIAFTKTGPEALPTFYTEAEARTAYNALEHGYIAAQIQVDLKLGARGGQDTAWNEHK